MHTTGGGAMEMKAPATVLDAANALLRLVPFIGLTQRQVLREACRASTEEHQYFWDLLRDLDVMITAMPKTYEQNGKGEDAMVYLHYFVGSQDWYIMEKDTESVQHQAFGFADLSYGGELGYISIHELTTYNVELDLYWEPKTLEAVKTKGET